MNPISAFKLQLASSLDVPAEQWPHLEQCLQLRKLSKDEVYYSEGTLCDEVGFLVDGLVYNYYTNEKGDEFVKNFVLPGNPVASYMSVILTAPAAYTCKAIEESVLVTMKYKDLLKLYDLHPCWDRLGRMNAEKCFFVTEQREQQLLTMDATTRYAEFLKNNRELANRIPQYLIASYIGVSPVTLSRIRAK
jgi:CRP-like cAMP-binding protein